MQIRVSIMCIAFLQNPRSDLLIFVYFSTSLFNHHVAYVFALILIRDNKIVDFKFKLHYFF